MSASLISRPPPALRATGISLPAMRRAQAQRVNTLASGRPLGYGEYKDCTRPLRRLLKQYGSGSLEAGLRFAKANGNALAELVALLNVDLPVRDARLPSVSAPAPT